MIFELGYGGQAWGAGKWRQSFPGDKIAPAKVERMVFGIGVVQLGKSIGFVKKNHGR